MKEKIAQQILKDAGLYSGEIDGDFASKSIEAALKYYNFPVWKSNKQRLVVGVIQVACIKNDINSGEIDGLWGNDTQTAFEEFLKLKNISQEGVSVSPVANVKKTYNSWPKQDYNSMVKFYGKVGENQTSLILPYPMVLAWDTSKVVTKITCHELVKDSLERIFKNVLNHYGDEAIKKLHLNYFGGCLNVRKMRGGSSWSIHSWGAAVDIDPDRNQLKWGKNSAFLAREEFNPFWQIVEAEGWTSLGRARNYDWMHIQAANL